MILLVLVGIIVVGLLVYFLLFREYGQSDDGQNETGIHEIPSDIGEEIEEEYRRDDTEQESDNMDSFDQSRFPRGGWSLFPKKDE